MAATKHATPPTPTAGIYYLVPNVKTKGYDLMCQTEEGTDDPVHIFYWDEIKAILARRFKADASLLDDAYTGIPRGRICAPDGKDGDWIVAHGGDVEMKLFTAQILDEFGLTDANARGRVRYEHVLHEEMGKDERRIVEKALGIALTRTGYLARTANKRRKRQERGHGRRGFDGSSRI